MRRMVALQVQGPLRIAVEALAELRSLLEKFIRRDRECWRLSQVGQRGLN
jgi:hypothetical protein